MSALSRLTIVSITVSFAIGGGGCKSKRRSDRLAKLGFATQICECRDKACADKVDDEMTRWSAELKTAVPEDKPDPEVMMKSAEASARYVDCRTKLTRAASVKRAP